MTYALDQMLLTEIVTGSINAVKCPLMSLNTELKAFNEGSTKLEGC
jgi:hypothetical protein